jgi:hypothetical protein
VDPDAIATRRRVTVVEDENAEFGVPRLVVRGTGSPGLTGPVTWELSYGGLPIATGALSSDQQARFIEAPSIEPSMDSAGLAIAARYGNGDDCAIEAVCVRPMRPPTRAEATARARWPHPRNQRERPLFRRPFLAGTRDIPRPDSGTDPGSHWSVCVYQPVSVLLAARRRLQRGEPLAAPQRAGPGSSG